MEKHDHDPTLDPITCARIDALEEAILNGNVVPLQIAAASSPIAPDMQAKLAEHNARVENVINEAAKTFQGISRSENERISAMEARMETIESILRRFGEKYDQEAGDK